MISYNGHIVFDPIDRTKKHKDQSTWKRTAFIVFECDIAEYYAWFIKRRYNITLQPPMRGAHVTFINDGENNMNGSWETVKQEWGSKEVEVTLDTNVRTNGQYWWMRVEPNDTLNAIRSGLGLGLPYFPFHMTIGYPNEKNQQQSDYIHGLLKKGLCK